MEKLENDNAIFAKREEWNFVKIAPENFDNLFAQLICTGYKTVNINGQTKVKIEDVYDAKPIDTYGHTCVDSCIKMIDYK